MKEKLKRSMLALSSAISELCGSISGYSGGMMIVSGSYALARMLITSLKGRKKPHF